MRIFSSSSRRLVRRVLAAALSVALLGPAVPPPSAFAAPSTTTLRAGLEGREPEIAAGLEEGDLYAWDIAHPVQFVDSSESGGLPSEVLRLALTGSQILRIDYGVGRGLPYGYHIVQVTPAEGIRVLTPASDDPLHGATRLSLPPPAEHPSMTTALPMGSATLDLTLQAEGLLIGTIQNLPANDRVVLRAYLLTGPIQLPRPQPFDAVPPSLSVSRASELTRRVGVLHEQNARTRGWAPRRPQGDFPSSTSTGLEEKPQADDELRAVRTQVLNVLDSPKDTYDSERYVSLAARLKKWVGTADLWQQAVTVFTDSMTDHERRQRIWLFLESPAYQRLSFQAQALLEAALAGALTSSAPWTARWDSYLAGRRVLRDLRQQEPGRTEGPIPEDDLPHAVAVEMAQSVANRSGFVSVTLSGFAGSLRRDIVGGQRAARTAYASLRRDIASAAGTQGSPYWFVTVKPGELPVIRLAPWHQEEQIWPFQPQPRELGWRYVERVLNTARLLARRLGCRTLALHVGQAETQCGTALAPPDRLAYLVSLLSQFPEAVLRREATVFFSNTVNVTATADTLRLAIPPRYAGLEETPPAITFAGSAPALGLDNVEPGRTLSPAIHNAQDQHRQASREWQLATAAPSTEATPLFARAIPTLTEAVARWTAVLDHVAALQAVPPETRRRLWITTIFTSDGPQTANHEAMLRQVATCAEAGKAVAERCLAYAQAHAPAPPAPGETSEPPLQDLTTLSVLQEELQPAPVARPAQQSTVREGTGLSGWLQQQPAEKTSDALDEVRRVLGRLIDGVSLDHLRADRQAGEAYANGGNPSGTILGWRWVSERLTNAAAPHDALEPPPSHTAPTSAELAVTIWTDDFTDPPPTAPAQPAAGLEEPKAVARWEQALRSGPVIVEVSKAGEAAYWSPQVTDGEWVPLASAMTSVVQAAGFGVTAGTRTIRLRAADRPRLEDHRIRTLMDIRPLKTQPVAADVKSILFARYHDWRGASSADSRLGVRTNRDVIMADVEMGRQLSAEMQGLARPRILGLPLLVAPLDADTLAWLLRASTLPDQKGMLLIQSFRVDQGALYITTAA